MIVEATREQATLVARCGDPVLGARCKAYGIDLEEALLRFFDASSYRRAWLEDGKLLGIGGVAVMADMPLLWIAVTPEARHMPKKFVISARLGLDEAAERYGRLTTFVAANCATDVRFAEYMGFHLGPVKMVGGHSIQFGERR